MVIDRAERYTHLLGRRYSRLRFKHLQLIEALGRSGNMGQAANEMKISQPAASKILQDAEHIFDAALFERQPRGLLPTDVGFHIIRYAQQSLNEMSRVAADVGEMKAGGAGAFHVGALMAAMPAILPSAIAELRRRRPLLTIHLTATTSDEIVRLLDQRELEIGLCRLPHANQRVSFDFEELFDEQYWVFIDRHHPLAGAEEVDFADLISLPWVLQPPSSPSRQVLEAALAESGLPVPRSRVETTSRFATLNLVKHAGMVGLLPSTILLEAVERGELVKLELAPLRPPSKYGLVKRRGEDLSEHALDFTSIIRGCRDVS